MTHRFASRLRLLALVALITSQCTYGTRSIANTTLRRAAAPLLILYLPIVMKDAPLDTSHMFIGANGGPIDGGAGSEPFDGNLAHSSVLRSNSFNWMTDAGIHWFRNYASDGIVYSWRFVEPQNNVFDWTVWDLLVQQAQYHNIEMLASIGNAVPSWANAGTPYGGPPLDFRDPPTDLYSNPMEQTAWYNYVNTIVERYDGDGNNDMPGLTKPIKYWELWNEPDLRRGWPAQNSPDYCKPHQYDGTVQDYVRLTQVGYAAVKAADSTASVVGPSTAQAIGTNWTECWYLWHWQDFIDAGGLKYVDIVSFVRYMPGNWDEGGTIDLYLNMANNGRGNKPVWLVETGWDPDNQGSHIPKARDLVRSAIIFWSVDFMERYFWYNFHASQTYSPGQDGTFHKAFIQTLNTGSKGTDPDPLFHPVFRSSEVMSNVLRGFTTATRPVAVDVGNTTVRVFKFTSGAHEVWVFWNKSFNPNTLTPITINTGGKTTRVIGLFGEDLGTFAGGQINSTSLPTYLTTELNWNQNVGRITGRVKNGAMLNQWDNGLVGVEVTVTGPVNASAVTDSAGVFSFVGLPVGVYTVTVPGYTTTPANRVVEIIRNGSWGRTSFVVN